MEFAIQLDDELSLTLVHPRHAEEIFAVIDANRAHIARWLSWVVMTVRVEDTRQFAAGRLAAYSAGQGVSCSIRRQGRVVGGVGLMDVRRSSGVFEASEADLGYWLAEAEQGRGAVTRAAVALLDHGFGELGLRRITIRAESANSRSRAVPCRLGFTHEGTLRGVGRYDGRRVDHELYAMLAEDWPAARAAYHAMRFQTNHEPAGPAGR
ncbi:MAG: GNAT family N-acetyltransferase [Phycisphaeraceae bacterium]|nr:GNAT family N-acetyltransferase [Phycisphaeraceae bacterium]